MIEFRQLTIKERGDGLEISVTYEPKDGKMPSGLDGNGIDVASDVIAVVTYAFGLHYIGQVDDAGEPYVVPVGGEETEDGEIRRETYLIRETFGRDR